MKKQIMNKNYYIRLEEKYINSYRHIFPKFNNFHVKMHNVESPIWNVVWTEIKGLK